MARVVDDYDFWIAVAPLLDTLRGVHLEEQQRLILVYLRDPANDLPRVTYADSSQDQFAAVKRGLLRSLLRIWATGDLIGDDEGDEGGDEGEG